MKFKSELITVTLLLLMAFSVAADTELIQVSTTEPAELMGRKMPGRTDTSSVWFGEERMSMESEQVRAIVRNDLGLFYILMPQHDMYVEFPLSMLNVLADSDSGSVEPTVSAVVTVTDSTKTLGPWKCRKYLVEMTMKMGMTSSQEIWATEDVDVDYQSLATASMGMMASFPGYDELIQEWQKIKGLPVEISQTVSMMGVNINSFNEVVSVTTKEAPAGIYEIPEGYTKVDQSQLSPH